MKLSLLLISSLVLGRCTETSDINGKEPDLVTLVAKNRIADVRHKIGTGENVNTSDRNGRSLLLIATKDHNWEMARLLVALGADAHQEDNLKNSPLLEAEANRQTKFIALFKTTPPYKGSDTR